MSAVRVNAGGRADTDGDDSGLSPDQLRAVFQDCHLNLLVGAGTSSGFFARLGNIELALTELADMDGEDREALTIAAASIFGYFFENVLEPNIKLIEEDASAKNAISSYAALVRTLNRILIRRRSTLIPKQANIFTTNVDMLFEKSLEATHIDYCDGFSGKIDPIFDTSEFGTLHYRISDRYLHRSEMPTFNLIKIHGSASWRRNESPESEVIRFDHGLMRIRGIVDLYRKAKDDLLSFKSPDEIDASKIISDATGVPVTPQIAEFKRAYERLAVVNPDKRKFASTVMNETYYELMRRFANELEKENAALFVHGFSFRDEHIRKIILRAARSNPTLQVVVFCYSRSDRESYREIMNYDAVKNGNIIYIQPKDSDDERNIDLDTLVKEYLLPVLDESDWRPDQVIDINISASRDDS
ncbi:hypothetical protein ACNAWD_03150 [Rhodococcus erythropolis]|uniref:hypothetical protein n=1 Tax=Rhodococcus erythropolis TaxID=1833 RepID=UPI003A4D9EB2